MEPKVKLALPGRFTISQLLMDDVPVTLVPLPELTLRATYYDTRPPPRPSRGRASLSDRRGRRAAVDPEAGDGPLRSGARAQGGQLRGPDPRATRRRASAADRPARGGAVDRRRDAPHAAPASMHLLVDETPVAEVDDDEVSVIEGRRVVSRFRELEVEALVDDVDLRSLDRPAPDGRRHRVRADSEGRARPRLACHRSARDRAEAGRRPTPDAGRCRCAASIADALDADRPQRPAGAPGRGSRGRAPAARRDAPAAERPAHARRRGRSGVAERDRAGAARGGRAPRPRRVTRRHAAPASVATLDGAGRPLAPAVRDLERRRAGRTRSLRPMLEGDAYVALLNDARRGRSRSHRWVETATARPRCALPALVLGAWDRLAAPRRRLEPDSPVDDFHRARIAVKRARYAAELAVAIARRQGG